MATSATYKVGPPERPSIQHDNGFLDKYACREPTVADRVRLVAWRVMLEGGEAFKNMPDATAAYHHFLDGKGVDRNFSYERYVANDSSGAVTLASAIRDAREGAEKLYADHFAGQAEVEFEMTSSAVAAYSGNRLFPYPATENWQKAIGAHNFWMSAKVKVKGEKSKTFTMELTLHVEDRYNFNPGQADIATGIPDSSNGIFEVTGLAKQYLNVSRLKRDVTWEATTAAGAEQSTRPDPQRDRKPPENRRLRNKI